MFDLDLFFIVSGYILFNKLFLFYIQESSVEIAHEFFFVSFHLCFFLFKSFESIMYRTNIQFNNDDDDNDDELWPIRINFNHQYH